MEYKVTGGSFSPAASNGPSTTWPAKGWRVVSAVQAVSWWRWRCPGTIVLERTKAG